MSTDNTRLRIGIVAPAPVPAVVGGAERLWRSLADGLVAAGHDAEVVTLPFPETTLGEVVAGYRAFRDLDVARFDVVITGKYPAWMIDHPCHIVYMLHPLRGLYDTYPASLGEVDLLDSGVCGEALADAATAGDIDALIDAAQDHVANLGADPRAAHPSALGRAIVHRLDQLAFAPGRVHHLAAISEEVAGRPDYFPTDRAVQVVHPVSDLPIGDLSRAPGSSERRTDFEGPVFFTVSRHDKPKRIDLIIRAFRRLTDGHNDRQLSLVIAGDGPEREALEQEASGNERIEFAGRISEEELAAHYRDADVTVFLPLQEDFGYVSLESMLAGTPVLTTSDAGGANELLGNTDTAGDGIGGTITEPTIDALAQAMDRLADDPYLRWQLGLNGHRRAKTVSWDPLVATIEEAAAARVDTDRVTEGSHGRPHALMVSTFGIEPAIGGGQRRVRHLARALARNADVTVLALGSAGGMRRRIIEPGITLVEIPRSPAHLEAEAEITRIAGFPVDDITCGRLWPSTPAFVAELDRQLANTDVVISSHPFLAPAIEARADAIGASPRFVYDSHNAETPFKTAMLSDVTASAEAVDWLVTAVTDAETTAVRRADHISACTADDLVSVQSLVETLSEGTTTAVVANGVDTAAMPRRTDPDHRASRLEALAMIGLGGDEHRPLAVFIGSWHPPNLDAARLIIEIADARPDLLFALAGSHTLQFDQSTVPANVRLLAAFAEESLWPLLAGSDVALNPMISGGGSNLKLYDYLAVGLPVVATPTGARGLDDPEASVWIGEPTPDALGDTIDAVLSGPDLARARSDAGRLVAEQADWRRLGEAWATDVIGPLALNDRPPRPWPTTSLPIVASTTPPPSNPTIELMGRIADAALDPAPPVEITTMNPNLREQLKRMAANRHAGRQLPHDARLKLAKKALIRAGQAITNEQVVFNEAAVDVVTELSEHVTELEARLAAIEGDDSA